MTQLTAGRDGSRICSLPAMEGPKATTQAPVNVARSMICQRRIHLVISILDKFDGDKKVVLFYFKRSENGDKSHRITSFIT